MGDFENERFDLITSWFPGRMTTAYDPDTTPKEFQPWICNFCKGDNAPHTTRCVHCKEETRALPGTLGKNLRLVLKALLEMTTTCPHTQADYVKLAIAAHEAKGAITQTKICKTVQKKNFQIAVSNVAKKRKKKKGEVMKEFRAQNFEQHLLPLVDPEIKRQVDKSLEVSLKGIIKGLQNQGLGGIFKSITIGAAGHETSQYAFTEFGSQYVRRFC